MERHPKHKRSQNQGFGLVIFFIVFLWFYLPSVINWISPSLEKSGQTGDTFGSVNALFSGLALAGIVYTIWYQKKFSNQQNFENKFFQLITLHHTIVSGSGEHVINLFQHISRQIKEGYEEERRAFDGHFTIEDLVRLYERNYKVHHAVMAHYFRNLYHIVKIVDESEEIDEEVKYSYIQILRAQLSSYEIVLLAYNGLTEKGEKFKDYINTYFLLHNMDSADDVVEPNILKEQYPHLRDVLK